MISQCFIRKLTDLCCGAFSSTSFRCICFHLLLHVLMFLYYSFSASATLSRFLADDAATRKQLAQVKGRLAKMEAKEKEMLQ